MSSAATFKAVKTPGLCEAWDDEDTYKAIPRGAFEFKRDDAGKPVTFWFICPGCGWLSAIAIRPSTAAQSWEFDGNEEAPTLHPSINHVDCWHGWLKNGVFAA